MVPVRTPIWLQRSKDGRSWIVDEDRAATIRLIFELAAGGMGQFRIVHYLNENRIPTIRSGHGWYMTYIAKTLHSRAVIGEAQFGKLDDNGKRVLDTKPIPNYYP